MFHDGAEVRAGGGQTEDGLGRLHVLRHQRRLARLEVVVHVGRMEVGAASTHRGEPSPAWTVVGQAGWEPTIRHK